MSNHLLAQLLGFAGPGVFLLALIWVPFLLRRRPRRPGAVDAWHGMSSEGQRAHDNAVLGAHEAADNLAARQAEAAKRNALFHP
jgi:hypothetical protein